MAKKISINKLFNRADCYGWAWECKGKRHHYCWQNDNDLGLLGDIDECNYPETIVRKIKIAPKKYIYILRNNYGMDEKSGGRAITEPQLIAAIKDCHCMKLTKHEQILASRVFDCQNGGNHMNTQLFKEITDNLKERINLCEKNFLGADNLEGLTVKQIRELIAFCRAEQSTMDQIKHNEIYHIIGMGNLSAAQMTTIVSLLNKYLSYSSDVKALASVNSLDQLYLPTDAEYKLTALSTCKLTYNIRSKAVGVEPEKSLMISPEAKQCYGRATDVSPYALLVDLSKVNEFATLWGSICGHPEVIGANLLSFGYKSASQYGWKWSIHKQGLLCTAKADKARQQLAKF